MHRREVHACILILCARTMAFQLSTLLRRKLAVLTYKPELQPQHHYIHAKKLARAPPLPPASPVQRTLTGGWPMKP